MKYCIVLIMFILASCASKFPMKIDATDYIKGLEETDSMAMLPILQEKNTFCLIQAPELDDNRSLIHSYDQEVLYTYLLSELLGTDQSDRVCNAENTMTIKNIQFTWDIYNTMRLHRYIVDIELVAAKQCVGQERLFESKQQRRLIKKGFHNHEVSTTIFAAALKLTLNDALSDIKSQVQKECVNNS